MLVPYCANLATRHKSALYARFGGGSDSSLNCARPVLPDDQFSPTVPLTSQAHQFLPKLTVTSSGQSLDNLSNCDMQG